MLGAIIGDIVGSRFEFHNIKTKKFKLFTKDSCPTDDSIMTAAVDECLLNGYKNPKRIVETLKNGAISIRMQGMAHVFIIGCLVTIRSRIIVTGTERRCA